MALCLDANVFIEAHRVRYPRDVFPGFWDALLAAAEAGLVHSIDEVYVELKRGDDELSAWATEHRKLLFQPNDDAETQSTMERVGAAIDGRTPQYTDAAKEGFLTGADPWLAAWCCAHNHVLVTEEVDDPKQTRRVRLPAICRPLGVETMRTLGLLRELGLKFIRA